jgi:hypothetical protein
LKLAEDPLSFKVVYPLKYFQIFSYFICEDRKLA